MKKTTGVALVLAAILGAGSDVRAAEPALNETPLYERLGGMPAIRAVVDGLLDRIQKDNRINAWFGFCRPPAVGGILQGQPGRFRVPGYGRAMQVPWA